LHSFVDSAIANQESLSILEVEMRKLEGVVKEITDEMDYLKRREERMRDTNGGPGSECRFASPPFRTNEGSWLASSPFAFGIESTNSRVQNFALFTMFVLVALGVWQVSVISFSSPRRQSVLFVRITVVDTKSSPLLQILHLRSFFKRKYLID
jgi:hypothetical protein